MRVVSTIVLALALIDLCAPAAAGDALPESGAAKLAAYQVCRPLGIEVYQPPAELLAGWHSPQASDYRGNHGLQSPSWTER